MPSVLKARNPISVPGMLRMVSSKDLLESKSRREEGPLNESIDIGTWGRRKKWKSRIIVGIEKVYDIRKKRVSLTSMCCKAAALSTPLRTSVGQSCSLDLACGTALIRMHL